MVLYLILALVAIGLICMVIILVKLLSKEEATAVSAKDFDRLEGRVSDENRKARQELADNIYTIRKELSDNADRLRSVVEEKLSTMSEKFQEGFEKNTVRMVEAQKERFAEMDKRQESCGFKDVQDVFADVRYL